MKIGKQQESAFNDRIDINVSPSQIENLIELVEDRAMSEEDYAFAGIWRELKDLLQGRLDVYEQAREKKNI